MDIIGAQAKVGVLPWLPIGAELPDIAAIGLQVWVAAGDRVHEHSLTRREVEDPCVRRIKHRIAELMDGRSALLASPAGDETEALDRREIGSRANRRQRAEVRQLIDLGVRIQRQVAERTEVP